MNSDVYTKQRVEKIPLGSFSVSIMGLSDWAVSDRVQRLAEALSLLIGDVSLRALIPACNLLRLFIVTYDIRKEITHWQEQLKEPVSITDNAEGVTAGKCLFWGSGDPESTYAVVIVSENIGINLIEGQEPAKGLSKALIVHELSHIHDDYSLLKIFGPTNPPMNDEWFGIRHAIATASWGEYFAESIAAPYYNEKEYETRVNDIVKFFSAGWHRIKQAISEYQNHCNIGILWQIAGDELSGMFNHFGRVLGFIKKILPDRNGISEKIITDIFSLSPPWGQIVRHLDLELNMIAGQPEWNSQTFIRLEKVIEEGFNASGFYPVVDARGLRVSVQPPFGN
jgi:hypothetical protein